LKHQREALRATDRCEPGAAIRAPIGLGIRRRAAVGTMKGLNVRHPDLDCL